MNLDPGVLTVLVLISIVLNIFLFMKLVVLKGELEDIKQSTRLTSDEVNKLNERLKSIKLR
ncbi:hypothetical protein [Methanococcus maripaludis]|jgi:L-lactate permease|uniref:L-lactate permease n=4 Tax=Methanococcus maripaludis TaxID=39152 RepID=A0A7J9S2D3_METMI|nr:hypothetical protein [Methanococcus maripaludis]MDK2929522.1 hypothetical protein [Methanococcus sp.]AEK19582.1 hypothetical protein GYY_03515 [Methanococcus maripaludis X1]MBA2846401.1 L-lactate permease [Methanococcus maripaludis]MBA2851036.1 L-lactate permease [Methanococcus maripaludis]MBA2858505.1 L-lactate permease [Methanococcus maripaludis]